MVPIQTKAWFKTDDIGNCKDNSNAYCSGCCFDYPKSSSDACSSCVKSNDLVIECSKLLPTIYSALHALIIIAFDDSKLDKVTDAGWPAQQCAFTNGAIKYGCRGKL